MPTIWQRIGAGNMFTHPAGYTARNESGRWIIRDGGGRRVLELADLLDLQDLVINPPPPAPPAVESIACSGEFGPGQAVYQFNGAVDSSHWMYLASLNNPGGHTWLTNATSYDVRLAPGRYSVSAQQPIEFASVTTGHMLLAFLELYATTPNTSIVATGPKQRLYAAATSAFATRTLTLQAPLVVTDPLQQYAIRVRWFKQNAWQVGDYLRLGFSQNLAGSNESFGSVLFTRLGT